MKQKKCAVCPTRFTPSNTLQKVCGPRCALWLVDIQKAKKAKQQERDRRRMVRKGRERLKSRREWEQDAQKEFNKFIRERDYFEACICCGRFGPDEAWKPGGQWDAGHLLSVGSHPELRFNEDNCHKQLKSCNAGAGKYTHKNHTVSMEYRERLIVKIGQPKVEWLEGPHPMPHLGIEGLKAIRDHYRAEARRLRKERESVGDVSGLGMAAEGSTVSDRDMEAAERDTVLPADMASRRAG